MNWEGLLDLLFPPKCPFCGRVVEERGICSDCAQILSRTDDTAGKLLPGGVPCAAPFWYEGRVREGLLRLKFQGASTAAEPIGAEMAQCAAERFSGGFDVVAWIPVSRKRLRRRGYDQARLLAEAMCRVWSSTPEMLLEKCVENAVQSRQKTPNDRWRNVQNAYRGLPAAQGKRVLLVDDICTTGATLSAGVKALLEAGAESVVCITAAMVKPEAS